MRMARRAWRYDYRFYTAVGEIVLIACTESLLIVSDLQVLWPNDFMRVIIDHKAVLQPH